MGKFQKSEYGGQRVNGDLEVGGTIRAHAIELVLPTETIGVTSAIRITCGTGAPSAVMPDGSLYLRRDGTGATTIYTRSGGAWVANGIT